MFDLRTFRMRWQVQVQHGVCFLEANDKYEPLKKLVAACTFGNLDVFDFSEGTSDASTVSHVCKEDADELSPAQRNELNEYDVSLGDLRPTVWCVRHLPQNPNIFATCGASGMVRIWH